MWHEKRKTWHGAMDYKLNGRSSKTTLKLQQ